MGHSDNTQKEWLRASLRMPRDEDGAIIYPPILSRKPRRGDRHPISAQGLKMRLPGVLPQYLYGLRRIELRARRSDRIGEPFGCYLMRERIVVLYSLPMQWKLDRLSDGWRSQFSAYGAEVCKGDQGIAVHWTNEACLDLWFWDQVVMHELGHHFVEQYRSKNGRVRTRKAHEALADMHVGRYLNRRFQRLKQMPPAPSEESPPSEIPDPNEAD
jgi:hypothetical protein